MAGHRGDCHGGALSAAPRLVPPTEGCRHCPHCAGDYSSPQLVATGMVPALNLSVAVAVAASRLAVSVPEDKLVAALNRLSGRLESAAVDSDSGEGTITIRWNRGRFR